MPTNPLIIKGEGEVIFPTYDITTLMKWGDTVSEVTSSIKVLQGGDDNAETLLYSKPTFVGNIVRQPIFFGIPGVTYEITTHAFTNAGDTIDIVWLVSVAYGSDVSLITERIYTLLYPFYFTDTIDKKVSISDIFVFNMPYDDLSVNVSMGSVNLIPTVDYKTYTFDDNIAGTGTIFDVSLIPVVDYKNYTIPVENVSLDSVWIPSVSLITTVSYKSYTIPVENLTTTVTISGVTLS